MTFAKKLNGYTLVEALRTKYISDYDLLSHYVPEFKGLNTKMKSNIRAGNPDKDASLHFKSSRGGRAVISDFGSSNTGLSVFQYLCLYLNVDSLTLFKAINRDFNIGLDDKYIHNDKGALIQRKEGKIHNVTTEDKEPWDIRYRSRKWGEWKIDKEFWYDGGGITTNTLNLFNVVPADSYWLMNSKFEVQFKATETNPTYIYVPDKSLGITGYKRKVYSPFKEEGKWINSLPATTCLSLHTLPEEGDTLLIQTSLKDTMTCFEMFKEEDIWNVDLFSESVFLSEQLFLILQRRFRRIILMADNDATGIRQATLFSETYGIPFIVFPEEFSKEKDPYGMVRSKGQEVTKKLILELINN